MSAATRPEPGTQTSTTPGVPSIRAEARAWLAENWDPGLDAATWLAR